MSTADRNISDDLCRKREMIKSRRQTRLFYGFGVLPAKRIKVCTVCGTICKANENFCTDCGAILPEKNLYELSVEDVKRCKHCGAILVDFEKFCPICGKNLRTA